MRISGSHLDSKRQRALVDTVASKLVRPECFDLQGMMNLPPSASVEAISEYLRELESSGADVALIQYRDPSATKDIARFSREGLHTFDSLIPIQSTTKAIFTLFLVHTMGEFFWENIDRPVKELVARPLREICPVQAWDASLAGVEREWGKRTLRQFLNHSSGTPFNEEGIRAEVTSGSPALDQPLLYTRYSNTGVEWAAAVLQQWIRENPACVNRTSIDQTGLEEVAGQFLTDYFWPGAQGEPPRFEVGCVRGFRHILGSGRMMASARQVAELPNLVRRLDPEARGKLLTPIGSIFNHVCSGLDRVPEYPEWTGTPSTSHWHINLRPNVVSNLFFRRPYGYATMGSFENNCDVVFSNWREGMSAPEVAALIECTPHFTVVRLQKGPSPATNDQQYGIHLQRILSSFFREGIAA